MPVAVDASTSATGNGLTSLSWSHTVGTGANRAIIVGVVITFPSGVTISGVTYGGTALTRIGTRTLAAGWAIVELWRLVNPPSGAANVVVTPSAATDIAAGAVSMTGVHQTTPAGTFASAEGLSTEPSVAVSGAANDLVIDVLLFDSSTVVPTVGAGQTSRWTQNYGANASGSTEAGAASVTMSWTASSAADWMIGGVAIKEAPAAGGLSIPVAMHGYRRRRAA